MTAVLNIVVLLLAGVSILFALFFVRQTLQSRRRSLHETYGVGRQEARQSMQINLVRGVVAFIVGLILLGVFGLSPRPVGPAETLPVATEPTPATIPVPDTPTSLSVPTATNTPVVEPTLEPSPTPPSPTSTPTSPPTETATPEPQTATVSSGVGVWLRSSPGTDGEQLERVLQGTVLTLLPGQETADGFQWQQVRTPDGQEGWVATDFITYTEE